MDEDEPKTEELLTVQAEREAAEAERARQAELAEEERAAERRADKAGYLREKLEQQRAADDDGER